MMIPLRLARALNCSTRKCTPSASSNSFSTTVYHAKNALPVPPRTPLPEKDYTIAYLKGSGPGGQKINKTSSAVQIKHLPSGIVMKCQDTRSREQNQRLAMRRLQDKLEMIEKEGTGEMSRIEKRWELLRKRKASRKKKAARKYRALSEQEKGENEDEELATADASTEGDEVEAIRTGRNQGAMSTSGDILDPFENGTDTKHTNIKLG